MAVIGNAIMSTAIKEKVMSEYIDKSNAIDILDDLWNRDRNNSRAFYLRLRKAIYDLPTEEIIHCKDCKYYSNVLYQGTQFEYGECDAVDEFYIKNKKPHDFCSMARLKE